MAVVANTLAKEQLLSRVPRSPGVYLWRDAEGTILYIGKAKSLRDRVGSYLHEGGSHTLKVRLMLAQAASLDFIVTGSDMEAMILESNLIKKHKPKYNVILKDDKHYPYLKLTVEEDFPRLSVVRRIAKDHSMYFGPYTSAKSMRRTMRFLHKVFPIRSCRIKIDGQAERPCIDYEIQRCLGPCIGAVNKGEYGRLVREVALFLRGKDQDLLEQLRSKMYTLAEGLRFEEAARIRDQIGAIERVVERQKIISTGMEDQDIIASHRAGPLMNVQFFFIRQGKLLGTKEFLLRDVDEEVGTQAVLGTVLQQYYANDNFIPPEIVVEAEVPNGVLLAAWLCRKRGTKVQLHVPQRGVKHRWIEMARENARLSLKKVVDEAAEERFLLEKLRQDLALRRFPSRVEAFDISNIHGRQAVGSVVVFVEGREAKGQYRRFKIRTVAGADDFAMMREVVHRRFSRLLAEGKELPDLVVIDGGRGQLNGALAVLEDLGVADADVVGLSKGRTAAARKKDRLVPEVDQVLTPEGGTLPFSHDSPVKHFLQRVRDESHRFAVAYHRQLRKQQDLASLLDDIAGVGAQRKKALLRHFGSVQRLRQASLEELKALPFLPRRVAETIYVKLVG